MKIIFSRKGFDASYGGYPSPILPDGRMISLPIPTRYNAPGIKYYTLRYDQDKSYFDLMKQLKLKIKKKNKWIA